ncbi:helix-turn-helix transcriptional regulator [Streptomyces sp. SID3343]|uniref:helix-turn-helix domain-containing protein n=1 Tax=Streptomyces sp. SID3343 TaxID=2690260 RepID=UPI00136A8EEF|nr:helix-turn-helix transcriptional regulator [Streptomyces sp. SID3343]MYW03813.1 helix-turn-helix domain-containing protein [Streptomyces sp. SID3343]
MPRSPSSSAQQARDTLGVRLREIRREAGLTARQVADRAGWHASKSSRLENGVTAPSAPDIRAWCAICNATDQALDLIATARSVDSMYMQWKRRQRTGLRAIQDSYHALYRDTSTFRLYSADVVPGFLQTHRYAHALLSSITRFCGTPDDAEQAATARVERSRIVHEPGRRFALVIEEAVLRHAIADPSTMVEQLEYLLVAMTFPQVSLGVIPLGTRRGPERGIWGLETFCAFDDSQVEIELLTAAINVTAPGEVVDYLRAFQELSRLAVHGARAKALIRAAVSGFD